MIVTQYAARCDACGQTLTAMPTREEAVALAVKVEWQVSSFIGWDVSFYCLRCKNLTPEKQRALRREIERRKKAGAQS